jgi:hypothetical protein
MAVQAAQQIADLKEEIARLQAKLQTNTKDLTLVAVVPTWAWTVESGPLDEFFECIENTGEIGNWSTKDKVSVAQLNVTDGAKAFLNRTPELRKPKVSWGTFNSVFPTRFRDTKYDFFHYYQLQLARKRPNESPRDFADRVRQLARNVTTQVGDPKIQKIHSEQIDKMMLASYTNGLKGNPGKHVRISIPSTMEEGVELATTVEQVEAQERRNDAFYVDADTIAKNARSRNLDDKDRGNPKHIRCYECEGKGHFARDCSTRKAREVSETRRRKSLKFGGLAAREIVTRKNVRLKERSGNISTQRPGSR